VTEKRAIPPALLAKVEAAQAAARDLEDSALALVADLKYPVDAHGSVLDMNQLNHLYPDLLPVLVYHLIRAGWRRVEDKRHIKARPVKAAGFYEDLVTWVPMDSPDEPINIPAPAEVSEMWSVKPIVTEQFEERQ
jgi:hypothetical protein